MDDEKYAQIQYDENDLENVTVKEVRNLSEGKYGSEDMVRENLKEIFENVQEMVKKEKEPESVFINIEKPPIEEKFPVRKSPMGEGEASRGFAFFGKTDGESSKREEIPVKGNEIPVKGNEIPVKGNEIPSKGSEILPKEEGFPVRKEARKPESMAEKEASHRGEGGQKAEDFQEGKENRQPEKTPQNAAVPDREASFLENREQETENSPQGTGRPSKEEFFTNTAAPEREASTGTEKAPDRAARTDERIGRIEECLETVLGSIRRLDKKFEKEILNSETRDSTVKTIYKELNEYKAGLVEKAMKEVLYDFIDIREMMLSRAKHLQKEGEGEMISIEEFLSYADDIGDILEKHDVIIYKGEPGVKNVATRQKIVRKAETEDESLVKTVAESLSYGYEYNGRVIYPEKISIFVKKK